MQRDEYWILACIGALCLGGFIGLSSAGDSGDDMRKLIYRAGLPPSCLKMLDEAATDLMEEDEIRNEALENQARSRL